MGEKRVIEQIASDEIYNDDWFLKDSVLHDTTKVQPSVIKEYVNQGMATTTALANEATARQSMDNQLASGIGQQMSNLADFYDTTKSYVVGDVCVLQSGELMRCIAPTSGAFDNTKWEQVTVDELFDDLNFSADAISYDNETSGLEADNVQDAIGETITKLSAVGSASGAIATFTDGSDLSMPKLEVAIEPVQEGSGDPSPENIRPILGWDEVNVVDDAVYGGFINWNQLVQNGNFASASGWSVQNSGSITVSNNVATVTFTSNENADQLVRSLNMTNGHKYFTTVQVKQSEAVTGLELYGGFQVLVATSRATTDWQTVCSISGQSTYNYWILRNKTNVSSGFTIQVRNAMIFDLTQMFGSTIADEIYAMEQAQSGSGIAYIKSLFYKDYYPYNSGEMTNVSAVNGDTDKYSTITLDLDGTRYGGKVDLVSGVMTLTHEIADLPSLGWGKSTNTANIYFYVLYTSGANGTYNDPATNVMSNIYTPKSRNSLTNTQGTVGISAEANALYIADGRFNDYTVAQFKEAVSDVQLLLPLATPLTIQLSPTVVKSLRGKNNVFADSGAILDAEYIRDLTTIINYILEQLGN